MSAAPTLPSASLLRRHSISVLINPPSQEWPLATSWEWPRLVDLREPPFALNSGRSNYRVERPPISGKRS